MAHNYLRLKKIKQRKKIYFVQVVALMSATILHVLVVCVNLSLTNGQLVIQQDGHTNSYSVATPSFQSSFTRIFGGGQSGGSLLARQQQQHQQQQQQQFQPQMAALSDQVLEPIFYKFLCFIIVFH